MKWIGIAVASLFMATPVFACGVHGTNAGNDINSWLADNANGAASSGNIGGSNTDGDFDSTNATWADGGQSSRNDDGSYSEFTTDGGDDGDVEVGDDFNEEGDFNGWGNENYWVNITLPNGNVVTINTSSESWDRAEGGAAIEAWLRDQGIAVIRDWFENYEPLDDEDSTFTG